MKTRVGLFVCMVAAILVPTVSAVTVDLSSEQEGTTLAPGDALNVALTVGNDSEAIELAVAVMDVQVGDGVSADGVPQSAPGNIPGISHKPIRIKVGPGESITKIFELILPDYKKLPAGQYAFTISVEVKGLVSQTQTSDTISFLLVKP